MQNVLTKLGIKFNTIIVLIRSSRTIHKTRNNFVTASIQTTYPTIYSYYVLIVFIHLNLHVYLFTQHNIVS